MNNDVKYVGIRKDLFDEIDEYAKLNGIKTTRLINNLLRDRFMTEKYGESPFDAFAKKVEIVETPPEIQKAVNENFWEMLDEDKKDDTPKFLEPTDKKTFDGIERITEHIKKEFDDIMIFPADRLVPQTPESQAIIDEHNRLLREKNNKPKKRRLK